MTVTLELLPVVSPSTLDLAEEKEVGEVISHEFYNYYVSLYTCVMKVAFILFKAPLEPEMNLSQILLDGNPSLRQTPKPKRFCTEEMIDIQTQLLKEVAELRKVQEELLQVERERLVIERETLEIKKCKL